MVPLSKALRQRLSSLSAGSVGIANTSWRCEKGPTMHTIYAQHGSYSTFGVWLIGPWRDRYPLIPERFGYRHSNNPHPAPLNLNSIRNLCLTIDHGFLDRPTAADSLGAFGTVSRARMQTLQEGMAVEEPPWPPPVSDRTQ